jgi:Flp pilus assembly protein TadB
MYPPILPGRQRRPGEEDRDWEERQDKLARNYDGSPWLTLLVNFSGFLAAFAGSFAALFVIGNLDNGTVWVPYAVLLAVVVGTHLLLRAERYRRRRARRAAALRRRALSGEAAARSR